jgi:tetraacyldisaccharide 4'-kinase
MMKLKKPKFWSNKKFSLYSTLLVPISYLIQVIGKIQFGKKFDSKKIMKICVGNIYLGGTGKTALSLKIYELLSKKGIKACFIKKYYDDQVDERNLLSSKGFLISKKNRKDCLMKAISKKFEIAIFDDGLQDKTIEYDKKIVCFNNTNWVGNGKTIPSGPLRENINSIKKYDHVFLNGNLENIRFIKKFIKKIDEKSDIQVGEYIPINIKKFKNKKKFIAFSGIGNHSTFITMLKKYKIKIIKDFEYPDHHNYSKKDIEQLISLSKKLGCKLLTTEKDIERLKNKTNYNFGVIKIDLRIKNEKKFINQILN